MADTVSHIDMPIEEYLRGVVGYQIADNALNSILFKRKIAAEAMASSLTEKQLDLCTADLYLWCAATPSTQNNSEDSDGGWKHVEGGWQTSAFDKRELRAMAKELYEKWGENMPGKSKMKIVHFGIR